MTIRIKKVFKFKNTKANGQLAGKEVKHEVPKFIYEEFINIKNAKFLIEKQYNSLVQQLVREALLDKNGTTEKHLQSIESVISKFIAFGKGDIERWCDSRECGEKFKKILVKIAMDNIYIPENKKVMLIDRLASLADKDDPIAEFLFTKIEVTEPDVDFDWDIVVNLGNPPEKCMSL